MKKDNKMTSHQVGVSAESYTATVFAWAGYDVSVQYGANQPVYDLIVSGWNKILKVSVKGSKDGGWGLTQSHLKNRDYKKAADDWVNKHDDMTIVSLVQFKGIDLEKGSAPKVYLATPKEIGEYLKRSRGGHGATALRTDYEYKRGAGAGHKDIFPAKWDFSQQRIEELFNLIK